VLNKFPKDCKYYNYGKWVKGATHQGSNPYADEAMIEEILPRTEDKGFFKEIVAWLKEWAPKKLRPALFELNGIKRDPILYEWLCKIVYLMNFRASRNLERRMLLGPSNKWVRKYFEDFPPGNQPDAT
jgi:hypothetical protein